MWHSDLVSHRHLSQIVLLRGHRAIRYEIKSCLCLCWSKLNAKFNVQRKLCVDARTVSRPQNQHKVRKNSETIPEFIKQQSWNDESLGILPKIYFNLVWAAVNGKLFECHQPDVQVPLIVNRLLFGVRITT